MKIKLQVLFHMQTSERAGIVRLGGIAQVP